MEKNQFFEHPILNSPYKYPSQHWELDESGQPTQKTIASRRKAEFITPIPKPRKQKGAIQQQIAFDLTQGTGIDNEGQKYDPTPIINTNCHAFKLRERLEISKDVRLLLQGRNGGELDTIEIDSEQLESGDVLGMRPFSTQLLCKQVIGRALCRKILPKRSKRSSRRWLTPLYRGENRLE